MTKDPSVPSKAWATTLALPVLTDIHRMTALLRPRLPLSTDFCNANSSARGSCTQASDIGAPSAENVELSGVRGHRGVWGCRTRERGTVPRGQVGEGRTSKRAPLRCEDRQGLNGRAPPMTFHACRGAERTHDQSEIDGRSGQCRAPSSATVSAPEC